MLFCLIHKVVRNDNPCPDCSKTIISFYQTQEECLAAAVDMLLQDEGELDDSELEKKREKITSLLLDKKAIWVDEWVRRRNGDMVQILEISESAKNLKGFEFSNCTDELKNVEDL